MKSQPGIYHDANNAIVVIKRTAKSLEPIIERLILRCRQDNFSEIATPKQLDIAQKSMKTIVDQCEMLLQWINQIEGEQGKGYKFYGSSS